MEINNTKEYTIELLKHYNDLLQSDFKCTVKNLSATVDDPDELATIISTAVLLGEKVKHRTDDLIEHIEKDNK